MNSSDKLIAELKRVLPTSFSLRGDPRYAAAADIWPKNSRRPVAIVHCAEAEQVRIALSAALDAGLPVSVRGGGHDWVGRALCDGVVIDLTPMRRVVVEQGGSAVEVGGGCRGIELFAVTDLIGMAATTASSGVVGLGGLTLGGGYGPLNARFGLACDGLIEAEVVLADGTITRTNANNQPDLLWALRGGGGNFGVVTSMRLALHSVRGVFAGLILYPFSQTTSVLDNLADFMAEGPEALDVQTLMVSGPDGEPVVAIAPTWSGTPKEGEAHIDRLRRLGKPLMEDMRHSSYGASRNLFDSYAVNGRRTFMATRWVSHLHGYLAAVMAERIACRPTPDCSIVTHDLRGAATRVDPAATAFGFRQPHVMLEIIAQSDEALGGVSHGESWVRETAEAFEPFSFPGGYANLLAPDERDRARDGFGPNALRLVATKLQYDPRDVFRSAIPLPLVSR